MCNFIIKITYVEKYNAQLVTNDHRYIKYSFFLCLQGSRVWIQHPVEVWESAEIVDSYNGKSLSVLTESGEVSTTIFIQSTSKY